MAIALTTNDGAIIAHVEGIFDRTIPKGSFSIVSVTNHLLVYHPSHHTALRLDLTTTLDGDSFTSLEDLAIALSNFSNGGGDGNGVTQEQLDERVPVLGEDDFLVGGENGNEGRKILGTDLGMVTTISSFRIPVWHGTNRVWSSLAYNTGAVPQSVCQRTSTGQGKFADAVNSDESVTLGQLDDRLPLALQTGSFILKSIDGVIQWVEDI